MGSSTRAFGALLGSGLGLGLLLSAGAAHAQIAFTQGNLAVNRIGNGTAALSNNTGALSILEFTTVGGAPVQTINLTNIVGNGTATSEGHLTRSSDGGALTLMGYATAAASGTNLNTTLSTDNPRVIARINANGSFDTSTRLTDAFSAGNPRSAVSNGAGYWMTGSNQGIRYTAATGNTTSSLVSTTVTNTRVTNITGGNLFFSTASGTSGIYQVGTGLPTGTGVTSTLLFATGAGSSPYDFALNAAATIAYVADDRATASGGGLQKWTNSGGTWTLAGTFSTGLTAGLRSVAVDFSGANPTIYATDASAAAAGNNLVRLVDQGDFTANSFVALASSGTNFAFRGVDFAPFSSSAVVPEPGALTLAGIGLLGLALNRRKKRI